MIAKARYDNAYGEILWKNKWVGFIDGDGYPSIPFKGSFSCKWGKKSLFFFNHYSIAYACRNTHVKFQAGIRKIVEVMNFFVTSCSISGFWRADFKRVFLETMFFKMACTITKEQLDIFQKFLYRIKLY